MRNTFIPLQKFGILFCGLFNTYLSLYNGGTCHVIFFTCVLQRRLSFSNPLSVTLSASMQYCITQYGTDSTEF